MPFLRAAGHALEFESIPGKGPTLVFLHEGLGSIRQWRDFPARVAAATGCPALIYARYGYGQSDVLSEQRNARFMHSEALQSLPGILRERKIEKPVLIGHSDGASISLIHAGAGNPVLGLAVLAPHVFVEEHGLAGIRAAKRAFAETDLPARLGKYHRDAEKTFRGWNDIWLADEFRAWNIEEYLPGIRCPVLAIQGEDDEYGTMAQVEAIRRQVTGPCEILKLARCGHSPHRDQPERAVEAVSGFIRGILSPA